MRHEYKIFEKLPNGSTAWRASVLGRYAANRKIQELAELSENEFVVSGDPAEESVSSNSANSARGRSGPLAKRAAHG